MKTVYVGLDWNGPGYYRAVREYSVNKTHYMNLQYIASLEDSETADWQRQKGFKVFRASTESDLPELVQ